MRTEKVTCDGCGADLTTRTNVEDYRLLLASEPKPGYGAGYYTSMGIYPAINRDHHFCDLQCLDQWRSHEKTYDAAMKKRLDGWIKENGSKSDSMTSYPTPPSDVMEAWKRESKYEANNEFPLIKRRTV